MKRSLIRRGIALFLSLALIVCCFGIACMDAYKAYAQPSEEQYLLIDGYANQWARSDLRAWLNGLTKVDNNLPLDGSHGQKSESSDPDSQNYLDCFTDAELNLFQPQKVVTTMYNDLDLERTTSEVVTTDRFWLPSGNLDFMHTTPFYKDQLISASPDYDLTDFYTCIQKMDNGADDWKNIIPVPFWGSSPNYIWLRSAEYDDPECALSIDRGIDVSYDFVDGDLSVCACGYIDISFDLFTAVASASTDMSSVFSEVRIPEYDVLGEKIRYSNASGNYLNVPSWGMYIKKLDSSSIAGTLEYDRTGKTLTFASESALPVDKYLMVQAYRGWDSAKTPTENAKEGDSIYVAAAKIENSDIVSVTFTEAPDLAGYTVKLWVEDSSNNESLAVASNPLTFLIDFDGSIESVEETKSKNPRVFS